MIFIDVKLFSQTPAWYFENKGELDSLYSCFNTDDLPCL